MKKKLISIIALGAAALLSCCSSIKSASLGAGNTRGKDYVTSLRPSAAARQYFAKIGNKSPMETLTRANSGRCKSGVRFVANDGILIPAGVTISFTNKGYCMDPKLPAPRADEEYQLVPTSALIPSQLQGIYQNLVKRAAAGDSSVRSNMQSLVWVLRTAGTENSYAARLSATQKRILDSCSSRPGEFERIHNSGLATNRLIGELWELADSSIQVDIGKRRWKPSDFSSAGALNSAINSQLNDLVSWGSKLPIQRTGFNYGELEPGIYTDIRGTGTLAFTAKIANSTNRDFIFYPCNYVGQVGSGSILSTVSFAAAPNLTQRQRVTMGPIGQVYVVDVSPVIENYSGPGVLSGKTSVNYRFRYTWTSGEDPESVTIIPEEGWEENGVTTQINDENSSRTILTSAGGFTITPSMQHDSTTAHEEDGHKALILEFGPLYPIAAHQNQILNDLDEVYAMKKGANKLVDSGIDKRKVDAYMASNQQPRDLDGEGDSRGELWKKYGNKSEKEIKNTIKQIFDEEEKNIKKQLIKNNIKYSKKGVIYEGIYSVTSR